MSLPGFIGLKKGMTQVFDESTGKALPVTVIELLPMTVTQIKSDATDGYTAVQVGVIPAKEKALTKPQIGHFTTKNVKLQRKLKEFRIKSEDLASFELGQEIVPESFEEGAKIRLTSRSKGKGTMGSIRRWGQSRGPMSHGSKSHRIPGSIGAGTTPGRVLKGHKMAGKTGCNTVTQTKISVVKYLPEQHLLVVKGSVSGAPGALVVGQYE